MITIEDLNINKNNLISFKKIQVKTFSENVPNNDFIIQFGNKIKINGKKYDAKNLNKILNQKSKNNILKKISKDIDIDLNNVEKGVFSADGNCDISFKCRMDGNTAVQFTFLILSESEAVISSNGSQISLERL